jgi:hypothetical protein
MHTPGVRHELPGVVIPLLKRCHLLAEARLCPVLQALLGHLAHEIAGPDPGKTRHVIDELLGVERGELASYFFQAVDQLGRDPAHPGVEESELSGGAATDHGEIEECVQREPEPSQNRVVWPAPDPASRHGALLRGVASPPPVPSPSLPTAAR